jgi:hypothetical protein
MYSAGLASVSVLLLAPSSLSPPGNALAMNTRALAAAIALAIFRHALWAFASLEC